MSNVQPRLAPAIHPEMAARTPARIFVSRFT
jgi:hypothetical protein